MIWEIQEETRKVEGLDEHGRARPDYAASLGLVPAAFGRRAAATLIEVLVVVVLQLPLLLAVLPAAIELAQATDPQAALARRGDLVLLIVCAAVSYGLTTAFVIVQLVLHGRRGVTLGKALLGIRSVNVRTLERPGFWRGAVIRYLLLWGSFLLPLLGPLLVVLLSPLFDPERRGRGWPDLAAATWFVDIRRGLNPYDAKRMRIARKTVASDLADERSELPSLATPAGERRPEVYIPVARNSGGVLGAARAESLTASAPAPAPAAPAPPAPASAPVASAPVSAAPAPVAPAPAQAAPAPAQAAPAPGPGPGPAPAPGAASVAPSVEPAPPPAPTAPPTPAPTGTWAPPTLLPEAASASPAEPAAITLVLDTGDAVPVAGAGVLIGRAPAADDGLVPAPVLDRTMSVSKTHLAVRREGDALFVEDRGSTNGSALVRGGGERQLAPGERVPVQDGDTIRFGDRHAEVRISRG